MPNRTAKFLSTIVAGCLAGAALTGVSRGATPEPAADTCLSGPKDQAPSGSHWYYRIDRATKRHCWYIGTQHDVRTQTAPSNVASTAPSKVAPSAVPSAPKAEAAMPGTVVNAHAELTASQTRGAQEASAAGQAPSAAPAGATGIGNSAAANAVDADAQRSLIATRWPDQSATDAADDPDPATDNSGASTQPKSVAPPPPATPLAATPVTATPLATAEAPSEKQSGSIRTLLIVIAGALALAGLVGGAIVRFGGRRRTDQRDTEDDRSEMWDAVRADHRSRPVFQDPVEPKLATRYPGDLRRAGGPRVAAANASRPAGVLRTANAPLAANIPGLASAPRAASDPDDKIAEMLARLARSAQT